jgi:hypothetical protein
VLLLIWDTVRARSLAIHGYARPNTRLEARRRGVTFDQAMSAAPWTLPSHVAMFSGRYPHETSAGWLTPLDDRPPLLAEVLARHGYVTAGFVANTHYTAAETGLARGMSRYEDWSLISAGDLLLSTAVGRKIAYDSRVRTWLDNPDLPARKSAARVDRDFLRWLDRRPAGRPFFAFSTSTTRTRPPAAVPHDTLFRTTGRSARPPGDRPRFCRAGARRAERPDGAIAYLDAQLGALLDELRRRRDGQYYRHRGCRPRRGSGARRLHARNSLYVSSCTPLVMRAPGASRRAGACRRRSPCATSSHGPGAGRDRSTAPGAPYRFWQPGASPDQEPPSEVPTPRGCLRTTRERRRHALRLHQRVPPS